jgi:hypothetical protein
VVLNIDKREKYRNAAMTCLSRILSTNAIREFDLEAEQEMTVVKCQGDPSGIDETTTKHREIVGRYEA